MRNVDTARASVCVAVAGGTDLVVEVDSDGEVACVGVDLVDPPGGVDVVGGADVAGGADGTDESAPPRSVLVPPPDLAADRSAE